MARRILILLALIIQATCQEEEGNDHPEAFKEVLECHVNDTCIGIKDGVIDLDTNYDIIYSKYSHKTRLRPKDGIPAKCIHDQSCTLYLRFEYCPTCIAEKVYIAFNGKKVSRSHFIFSNDKIDSSKFVHGKMFKIDDVPNFLPMTIFDKGDFKSTAVIGMWLPPGQLGNADNYDKRHYIEHDNIHSTFLMQIPAKEPRSNIVKGNHYQGWEFGKVAKFDLLDNVTINMYSEQLYLYIDAGHPIDKSGGGTDTDTELVEVIDNLTPFYLSKTRPTIIQSTGKPKEKRNNGTVTGGNGTTNGNDRPIQPADSKANKKDGSKLWIWIAAGVGGGLVILLIICCCCCCKKKPKKSSKSRSKSGRRRISGKQKK